jgi:solute carrier family 25 uncoupling protein 8/9
MTIVKEEGASALYKGIVAGVHRQILFAGLRVGLYLPVRDAICGPLKDGQNPALYQKALAALTTGAIGITVANPTDVVKVRLQNQRKNDLISGDKSSKLTVKYNGTLDCYKKTI